MDKKNIDKIRKIRAIAYRNVDEIVKICDDILKSEGATPTSVGHLKIPSFSLEHVSTANEARSIFESNRRIFNESLRLLNEGIQTNASHTTIARAHDKWSCALAKHWLKDRENRWRVCDTTFLFQGKKSNYSVDDTLEKSRILSGKVIADSESGQGFWYSNGTLEKSVIQHLEPLVECGEVKTWKWSPASRSAPMFIWN
jgi:hypothetical protein